MALPWTNTRLTIQGNTQRLVAAWNFLVDTPAGDGNYYELMWASPDTTMELLMLPEHPANGILPYIPAVPSIILTVDQVG